MEEAEVLLCRLVGSVLGRNPWVLREGWACPGQGVQSST